MAELKFSLLAELFDELNELDELAEPICPQASQSSGSATNKTVFFNWIMVTPFGLVNAPGFGPGCEVLDCWTEGVVQWFKIKVADQSSHFEAD